MRRILSRVLVRAAAALALAALVVPAAWPQGPMRTTTIRAGTHALKVEIADTMALRLRGLMFREKLGKNEGMLFVYEAPGYQSMWMKNTPLALSVAFVDAEGVILNVVDMEPLTLDSHLSAGPALYAIETNAGWFAERKLKAGDRVTGLPRGPGRP